MAGAVISVNAPKQGVMISSPMCVNLSENKFSGGTHERRKNNHMGSADHIILACGATDFRKQIEGLSSLVSMKYKLDPFASGYVFIFCNRRRNSIKVLRYDANGFVLATKKLLDGMKFQWPKDEKEVDEISEKQLEWLLEGLEIEQKKAHHPVDMSAGNNCF